MARWTEFRPGVLALEGGRNELDGETYLFEGGRWVPESEGARGRPLPAELENVESEGDRHSQRPRGHQVSETVF